MDGVRQVIVHNYARKYADLDLGKPFGHYGISWNSSALDPIVVFSDATNTIWIGVDRQVAAICLQSGRILVSMPFTINIVSILAMGQVTAVLTEEEILLFNPGGSLRFSGDLPDQATGLSMVGNALVINMLEGSSLRIDPMLGTFIKEPIAV